MISSDTQPALALRAIKARINGEFDHPALMAFGPLGDQDTDVLRITELALSGKSMPEMDKLTVNLNIFNDEGNVVDGTTAEMSMAQISDVIDHAAQLIIVRRSHRRSSGDTDQLLAELEEALVVSGVVQ